MLTLEASSGQTRFQFGGDLTGEVDIQDHEGHQIAVPFSDLLELFGEIERLRALPDNGGFPLDDDPGVTDLVPPAELEFRDATLGGLESLDDQDEATAFGLPDRANADNQDLAIALAWLESLADTHTAANAALRVLRRCVGQEDFG